MTRHSVKSSAIKSIGHQGEMLEVEFASGAIHRYQDVPDEIYRHLLSASSIGARFAANIRGKYTHTVVKPAKKLPKP